MTDNSKNEITVGGRRGRKSRSRSLSEEDIKRIQEAESGEKSAQEQAGKASNDEKPELGKDSLVEDYEKSFAEYEAIATAIAEKKTAVSEKGAERDAIMKQTQDEKNKLQHEFEIKKSEEIQKFIQELKDVQNALGTVVTDIEKLAADNDQLKNFIDGLGGIKTGLTDVFAKYASKDVPAPETQTPAEARNYTAQKFEKIEITEDTSAEDVKKALDSLNAKLSAATEEDDTISEKLEKITEMAERAKENAEADIERATKDLERKSPYVLEKIAKDVLQVADNLERAVQALTPQKETLGETFNAVSEKVGKAYDELQDAFNKFGIKKVDTAVGNTPNVEYDNVVAQINTPPGVEAEKGQIVMIDRVGYKLNDRVIRESTVAVAAN